MNKEGKTQELQKIAHGEKKHCADRPVSVPMNASQDNTKLQAKIMTHLQ
jgi:hypothetical protein